MGTRTAAVLASYAGHAWASTYSPASDISTNRDLADRGLGPAIGLLMVRHSLTYDDATNLLRTISRRSKRTIGDLAAEVIEYGDLARSAMRFAPPRRATA